MNHEGSVGAGTLPGCHSSFCTKQLRPLAIKYQLTTICCEPAVHSSQITLSSKPISFHNATVGCDLVAPKQDLVRLPSAGNMIKGHNRLSNARRAMRPGRLLLKKEE